MVWAATKIAIWDDIFPTFKTMSIDYKGKNPHLLYRKINALIRDIFRVPEGNIQEKEYTWNKTESGEEFKVDWESVKPFDNFSYIKIEITLNGFSAGGVGKANIQFRPTMITEYPQDMFWQQNILYEFLRRLWHTIYYARKRDEFYAQARSYSERFEREIKEFMEEMK